MTASSKHVYQFQDFYLDVAERTLLRNGVPVPLTPKAFDTLVALVSRSGQVVSKDELLTEVWSDTVVEEATLAQNIFTIRKALGRDNSNYQFIETVPKSGYRFVGEVQQVLRATAELTNGNGAPNHYDATTVNETGSTVGPNEKVSHEGSETPHKLEFLANIGNKVSARKILWAIAVGATLVLVAVLLTFLLNRKRSSSELASESFRNSGITRLTNSGKATHAAISHDGKYVAYVERDGVEQSLWVRQISAINNLQIIPPAPVQFGGVVFSPDDSNLYYQVSPKESPVSSLYKVPVLGGAPTKILADIDSSVTFSPDGKRIAFLRFEQGGRTGALILSNVDGTGELKLASPPFGGSFVGTPAWSPDGKVIVCPMRKDQVDYRGVVLSAVDVEGGQYRVVGNHQWQSIWHTAWLPDGNRLLMVAWDESISSISNQMVQVSYPDGDSQILVNDLHNYNGLSVAANGRSLVSIVSDRQAHLWVAPAAKPDNVTQITSGVGDKRGEVMGLAWTSDHKVVYGSTADDKIGLWVMDADGRNRKQLSTADSRISIRPTVSLAGGPIVFVSRLKGSPHLWKMNIDGSNANQLTNGNAENFPDFSPDGNWIVYTAVNNDGPSLWKIPVNGGQPIKVTDKFAYQPSISPDGKLIVAYYREDPSAALKAAVFTLDGHGPLMTFGLPPTVFTFQGIRWAPDGRSITFVDNHGGVSNIWSQPLDGSVRTKLTNFASDQIFRFAWSLDGKQIVFERGRNVTDVVLITTVPSL